MKKGTVNVPFFISQIEDNMEQNPLIEKTKDLLLPLLAGTDIFPTQIRVKPTNNIKVFLDADSGMSISKCAQINRSLYTAIEESGLFPDGDYSLEVSSPGVDEPLQGIRQYQKNIGRLLEVEPLEGKPTIGVLKAVTEEELTLEVTDKKKKETTEVILPFDSVKKAVVQVVFK